jgi:hypothetical protein
VIERLVAALQADGITINGTREIMPSLEDVFISMVDKKTPHQQEKKKIEH